MSEFEFYFRVISHLLHQYAVDGVILLVSVVYRKELFTAIAGGNHKLQMNELAQALILLGFYLALRAESLRADVTRPLYGDAFWFSLLGAVCLLAGIKQGVFEGMWKKGEKKPE